MRWLLIWLLLPVVASAQSSTVREGELSLWVEIEETGHTPLMREMVLVTINGIYHRHVTLETLQQPPLEGFSWSQLGPDRWAEERIDGRRVKTFQRRMALYPDRAGRLEIGAFTHVLTLTDERDAWFEHAVRSEPVTLDVAPSPDGRDWWFPVLRLEISDGWSNAPDQLKPGEGVLRIVRIEALGVTPEMIPPMPDLTSPSAMIFPHPEQRFVELTPRGPVSYAFWRWTIRPGNDVSTIVEPVGFDYFDTSTRQDRSVTISAQRVAYGEAVPRATEPVLSVTESRLPGWIAATLAALVFVGGLAAALRGRRLAGVSALRRLRWTDPLAWRLRRAARTGDAQATRRAAAALVRRDGGGGAALSALDAALFSPAGQAPDLRVFARELLHDGRTSHPDP